MVRRWALTFVQPLNSVGKKYLYIFSAMGRAPVAQLVEHRAVTREVAGSNPGRINIQDLKITEEKVLPL